MPIYTFQCPKCGLVEEKLVSAKRTEEIFHYLCPAIDTPHVASVKMDLVLSVPSPMQWGCRKGF